MRHSFTHPRRSAVQAPSNRLTTTPARRSLRALFAVIAVVAFASASAPLAQAAGHSSDRLAAQGWTCFTPPPRPDLVACYNPGQGRPFPGNPDPAPTYNVHTFSSSSGEFLATGHLVRADLYNGQPCGMDAYTFLPLIGYYECIHD
jgi:hypothetical protein